MRDVRSFRDTRGSNRPHTIVVGKTSLLLHEYLSTWAGVAARHRFAGLRKPDISLTAGRCRWIFCRKHLLIWAASYIGLEFAQMFRRFGSEVTILQREQRLVERGGPGYLAVHPGILEARAFACSELLM